MPGICDQRRTSCHGKGLVFPSGCTLLAAMKRILRALLVVAATLGLSACLEMKSVVTVNKDGTATVEEIALLGAQLKAMLGSLGAQPAADGQPNPADGLKDMVPDKAKAEARAKELGEGVTLKSHEEITTPDGKSGVKVVYAVADVNKLKYAPFNAKDKDSGTAKPMTFALAGDTLTITQPPDGDKPKTPAEKPQIPKEQLQAQMAMMKPMFAGMRMTMQVKGGSGIASSDATHLEGDTVTIVDMQIDKLLDKPELFGQFMEATEKNMTQSEAAEMFKGVDGVKVEGKKAVTVKLK
jgi:hypothetical protein